MNRVEALMPTVMEVLNNKFRGKNPPSEFNGYISNFGASVMMSGLKATIAMYENVNANTQADRIKLMEIILEILKKEFENGNEKKLLEYVLNRADKEYILKREILNIATAVKLGIRTFKLKKSNHEN